MTHARRSQAHRASLVVVLGALLLAAVPASASVPRHEAPSAAVASIPGATASLAALLPAGRDENLALFAGDELGRALGQGDATSRFTLAIGPDELDVAGLALASRVRELGFHPLQGLDLIDTESLRGPPECEPKTRIGGLELSEPFLQREKGELSLGLQWACDESGCGLVEGKPLDPLGLQEVQPGSEEEQAFSEWAEARSRGQLALRTAGRIAEVMHAVGEGATDLGPGIGTVKGFGYLVSAWRRGDRTTLAIFGGSVAAGSAVSILARRYERLQRVGAKAVNEVDEAILANESRAAARLNSEIDLASTRQLSTSLEASGEGALATAGPKLLPPAGSTTLSSEQVARVRGTGAERGAAFNQYLAEARGGTREVTRDTQRGRRVHDLGAVPAGNVTELAIEGKNYLRYRTVGGVVIEGRVPLSAEIHSQIHKDVLWMREGRKLGTNRLVQWEFAGAPPSDELAAMLQRWGLPYVHR